MQLTKFLSSIKNTRRILGIILIFAGLTGKIILFYCGLKVKLIENFTIYSSLDSSSDILIYSGGVLLGLTTFDLFKKND